MLLLYSFFTKSNTMSDDTPKNNQNVESVPAQEVPIPKRHTGRVKWFGKGFGFIVDVEDDTKEYFVHHTKLEINPESEKQTRIYRKLELGEYVNFDVRQEGDRMSAVCVTGIMEGPLMCESIALERSNRPQTPTRNQPHHQPPQRRLIYKSRGQEHIREVSINQ